MNIEKAIFDTIRSYNRFAKEYDSNVSGLLPKESFEEFIRYLPTSAKILDLGCGSGRDVMLFSKLGYEVIGVDLSEKLIEIAKAKAPKAQFYIQDIRQIEFQENTFDGIWASASLLHIPKNDIYFVLSYLRKIMKPDVVLYISLKQGKGEVFEKDKRYGNLSKLWVYYSYEEIKLLIEKTEFSIVYSKISNESNSYSSKPWIDIICKSKKSKC